MADHLELQIAAPIKAESSADLIERSLVIVDSGWLGVVALSRDPRTRPLEIAGEQLADRGHRVSEQRRIVSDRVHHDFGYLDGHSPVVEAVKGSAKPLSFCLAIAESIRHLDRDR